MTISAWGPSEFEGISGAYWDFTSDLLAKLCMVGKDLSMQSNRREHVPSPEAEIYFNNAASGRYLSTYRISVSRNARDESFAAMDA